MNHSKIDSELIAKKSVYDLQNPLAYKRCSLAIVGATHEKAMGWYVESIQYLLFGMDPIYSWYDDSASIRIGETFINVSGIADYNKIRALRPQNMIFVDTDTLDSAEVNALIWGLRTPSCVKEYEYMGVYHV